MSPLGEFWGPLATENIYNRVEIPWNLSGSTEMLVTLCNVFDKYGQMKSTCIKYVVYEYISYFPSLLYIFFSSRPRGGTSRCVPPPYTIQYAYTLFIHNTHIYIYMLYRYLYI